MTTMDSSRRSVLATIVLITLRRDVEHLPAIPLVTKKFGSGRARYATLLRGVHHGGA